MKKLIVILMLLFGLTYPPLSNAEVGDTWITIHHALPTANCDVGSTPLTDLDRIEHCISTDKDTVYDNCTDRGLNTQTTTQNLTPDTDYYIDTVAYDTSGNSSLTCPINGTPREPMLVRTLPDTTGPKQPGCSLLP